MKHILFCIMTCAISLFPIISRAQIGYQISLLNTATGEPRAGVTVNATITITDSSDKIIYTGTQRATSNDFGVLSLAVGNESTFSKANFDKLPFFISVSVDGALIGKSQILSVPVAEYAKRSGSELTIEKLVGTWKEISNSREGENLLTFSANGTVLFKEYGDDFEGTYFIDSNNIWIDCRWINDHNLVGSRSKLIVYIPSQNMLGNASDGETYTKQ